MSPLAVNGPRATNLSVRVTAVTLLEDIFSCKPEWMNHNQWIYELEFWLCWTETWKRFGDFVLSLCFSLMLSLPQSNTRLHLKSKVVDIFSNNKAENVCINITSLKSFSQIVLVLMLTHTWELFSPLK